MLKPYYETELGKLYHGDCLDTLKAMPDQSVHMCVTSPPYWGLRDYGTEPRLWDADPECEHVWESQDVKRKGSTNGRGDLGSTLVSVDADKTTSVGISTNDPGGTGQYRTDHSKFCIHCKAWRGSLGLEPTPELYVKHMVEVFQQVKRVLRDDGTLWLNLGDSYAGSGKSRESGGSGPTSQKQTTNPGAYFEWEGNGKTPDGIKPKDLIGIPWRVAFALQADGWYLRSDIIWSKPNPMPESVTDRPTKAHEYVFLLTKSQRYYYDADAIREPHKPQSLERWKPGTEKIESVGSKNAVFSQTQYGATRISEKSGDLLHPNGRNKRSVWTVTTKPFPEAHFATFPPKLIEPCILAGSPKGDIVLDPFFGAGTTGIVAYQHDRQFIGIELSEEYCEVAAKRIHNETRQLKLF